VRPSRNIVVPKIVVPKTVVPKTVVIPDGRRPIRDRKPNGKRSRLSAALRPG